MKKLTEALKQMLDALAFAHAGEHLSMRDKTQVLAQSSDAVNVEALKELEPASVSASSNTRRVALYLGSELPAEVIEYVIETCSSLKHELTVLTFQSGNVAKALINPYQQALEAVGVDMELVTLTGDPVSGLGRYLRKHPEVAFLACKDSGYLGRSFLKGTNPQNAIPVPVVVVTTTGEGTAGLDKDASSSNKDKASVA